MDSGEGGSLQGRGWGRECVAGRVLGSVSYIILAAAHSGDVFPPKQTEAQRRKLLSGPGVCVVSGPWGGAVLLAHGGMLRGDWGQPPPLLVSEKGRVWPYEYRVSDGLFLSQASSYTHAPHEAAPD